MNTNADWKLVPVEPTKEMWAAVNKLDDEMAAGAYDGKGASIEQVWNCLVDAAPGAPVVDGWLDIASAPKDGTAILVMQNNWPGCPGGVAQECNGHNTYVAEWWEGEGPGGAWVCYMDQISDPNCPIKPTHWMPLPAAPGSPPASAQDDAKDELMWRDGEPPFPQNQEWFIAETTYGDRVVLCALPKGMSHDYKTADETYLRANLIKRWMQFPDCEYLPPEAPAAGDALEVDPLQGAANWLVQAHGQPCPTVLSACLMIGYNRAQRLYTAAIAHQKGEA